MWRIVAGCFCPTSSNNLQILAGISTLLKFAAKELRCLLHAELSSLVICSTSHSPVHLMRRRGCYNRITNLCLLRWKYSFSSKEALRAGRPNMEWGASNTKYMISNSMSIPNLLECSSWGQHGSLGQVYSASYWCRTVKLLTCAYGVWLHQWPSSMAPREKAQIAMSRCVPNTDHLTKHMPSRF